MFKKYRIKRTYRGYWEIEYLLYWFPFFWQYEGYEFTEEDARKRVQCIKERPIYL